MSWRRFLTAGSLRFRHTWDLRSSITRGANEYPTRMATDTDKSKRGFAAMDEYKQRAIASKGGKSQGKENNPGNFANDPERAREAGRKGGEA